MVKFLDVVIGMHQVLSCGHTSPSVPVGEYCAYSVWVCAHATGFRYCIIIWVEHSYLMMSASWGKFIGVNFMVAFWELECS